MNNYIGDWGLGIGDWAQSPIPNPQSPIFFHYKIYNLSFIIYKNNIYIFFFNLINLNDTKT